MNSNLLDVAAPPADADADAAASTTPIASRPSNTLSGQLLADAAGAGADEPQLNNLDYLKAKEMVLTKLYEDGASRGLAAALRKAPNLVTGVVQQAMVLFSSVDESTNGAVPDNLLVLLALDMFGEVLDIATAAGLPITGTVIAQAMKDFLTAVFESVGANTSEVTNAMNSINAQQLGSALDNPSMTA